MLKTISLGVIGGGQLGSFLCSAAKKLKIKTVVLSDDKDGPAQKFCDYFIEDTLAGRHRQTTLGKRPRAWQSAVMLGHCGQKTLEYL